MRTPGADRELAAGFLLAERVIRSADDLGTIEHGRTFNALLREFLLALIRTYGVSGVVRALRNITIILRTLLP